MDPQLLDILRCPLCGNELQYDKAAQELICQHDALAYPIDDGIPVMLKEQARSLHPSNDKADGIEPAASDQDMA